MRIRDFFLNLILLNLITTLLLSILSNFTVIINFQIGFLSSFIIIMGSYIGFKSKIDSSVSEYKGEYKDIDLLDKIDDRFDLYSKEIKFDESIDIKEVIKEEKSKNRANIIKNLKYSGSFFSLYRIFGYLFLILGFFYLNNNALLNITIYLISLGIVPIAILTSVLFSKQR